MKNVYLDNNATTRVAPEVVEEMLPYFSDYYGNPSSMHYFGGQVEKKVVEAREKVAELLNCDPTEIIFTSCGTESDSTAIRGTLGSYPDKRHMVTSRVEHPAVLNLVRHLSKNGCRLTGREISTSAMLNRQSPTPPPLSASCTPTTKPASSSPSKKSGRL